MVRPRTVFLIQGVQKLHTLLKVYGLLRRERAYGTPFMLHAYKW
jgi:hypothetical protein